MTDLAVSHLLDAFQLPAAARVDRRIPKTTLTEHAPTSRIAKLLAARVTRLDWVAELSPPTVNVPAREEPPCRAVNILVLATDKPPTQELQWTIHNLIPAPIVLIACPEGQPLQISLAGHRRHERLNDTVLCDLDTTPPLGSVEDPPTAAFLASLALPGLPATDLGALYDALIIRGEALEAAHISGAPFRLPGSKAEAAARRALLRRWQMAEIDWSCAAAAAKREKRLAERVALGTVARQKQLALKALGQELV